MDENRRNAIMWEILMVCFEKMGHGKLSVLTPQLFNETLKEMLAQEKMVGNRKLELQEAYDFMDEFQRSITAYLQETGKQKPKTQMGDPTASKKGQMQ